MRRKEELSPDELRTHTDHLLSQIQERGLVLPWTRAVPDMRLSSSKIPQSAKELSAATFTAGQARQARILSSKTSLQSLAEEKSKAAAKAFAETIEDGESIEEIREALGVT